MLETHHTVPERVLEAWGVPKDSCPAWLLTFHDHRGHGLDFHGVIDGPLGRGPYRLTHVRQSLYRSYMNAGRRDVAEAVVTYLDDLLAKYPNIPQ